MKKYDICPYLTPHGGRLVILRTEDNFLQSYRTGAKGEISLYTSREDALKAAIRWAAKDVEFDRAWEEFRRKHPRETVVSARR